MRKPEVLEKHPSNMVSTRSELQRIEERDGELSFRGNRTMDYLNEFVQLDEDEAEELKEELLDLDIARLKEEFVHKIIDTLPRDMDELEVLLQGYTLSMDEDDMKEVMDIVEDYLPEDED